MLGWMIIVTKATDEKVELIRWETSDPSICWFKELESAGKTELSHNGGGYPNKYLVKANDLLPVLRSDGLIFVNEDWRGNRKAIRNADAIDDCQPDEMLCIEMWDLS